MKKQKNNDNINVGWVEHPDDWLYSSQRNYGDLDAKIDSHFISSSILKMNYPDTSSRIVHFWDSKK